MKTWKSKLLLIVLVTIVTLIAVTAYNWPSIQRLMSVNSLFSPEKIVSNLSNMRRLFFYKDMDGNTEDHIPFKVNLQPLPESFEYGGQTYPLADWQKQRSVTAMVVLKDGEIVHERYEQGTKQTDLRISWSVAKSFLSALMGVVVAEGAIDSLDDPVIKYVPTLKGSAYTKASIRNVLHMASGVHFNEDYLDRSSDINKMGRVLALGGSMDEFAVGILEVDRKPGTERQYVSIDTHVLGMVIRGATGRTIPDLLEEKILQPMGLAANPYYLTDGSGIAFVLGGLNMQTRDYARFGLMFAQNGVLNGTQIVPAAWVAESTVNSAPAATKATGVQKALGYGYQWWVPPEAELGEFFAVGIYGQYIYVNQQAGIVVAVNSADRRFKEGGGWVKLADVESFRAIAQHYKN